MNWLRGAVLVVTVVGVALQFVAFLAADSACCDACRSEIEVQASTWRVVYYTWYAFLVGLCSLAGLLSLLSLSA